MVPPFFLPLYGAEFGLSTLSSAALVSGFNLSSALGRVLLGQRADYIGPVNALIIAMISNGFALLVLWPVSMSLAPLIIFVIVSGIAAGKSLTDRKVGLKDRGILFAHADDGGFVDRSRNHGFWFRITRDRMGSGVPSWTTYRWVPFASDGRDRSWDLGLPSCDVLFGQYHHCERLDDYWYEAQDHQESSEEDVVCMIYQVTGSRGWKTTSSV
jgi:hypothetical protein